MKIFCLKGGLGNQLFEYCRYDTFRKENTERCYLFLDRRKLKQHHNVLISECFNVKIQPCPLWVNAIVWGLKACSILKCFSYLYDEQSPDAIFIDSYSQDKRYIHHARNILKFKPFRLSDNYQKYLTAINSSSCPVSIHVRRGDYLQTDNLEHIGICSMEYYRQAVSYTIKQYPDCTFFVFSDDMPWTMKNLRIEGAVYIKNNGEPDYADLYLQQQCKAHIIANSTFSFWGSWLNDSPQHLCIYPKQWFRDESWGCPDIFPPHWISM